MMPMRAVVITEPGGPDVLQLRDVPDPVPAEGEVVIEVAATAVNRADLLQRQGHYAPRPARRPTWDSSARARSANSATA